jgi:hypothetical protein
MILLLLLTIIAVEDDLYGEKVRITYYWVETASNTFMAVILYVTNFATKKQMRKKIKKRVKNTGQLPTAS